MPTALRPAAYRLLALLVLPALAAQATPHFEACSARTGTNATLIVPASAVDLGGSPMEASDELAVFTPDGVCAGWALWDETNTALALWADNPMTEATDGFVPGQTMHYVVWDASAGVEYGDDIPLEVTYDEVLGGDVFEPDAVYLVSSLSSSPPVANEEAAPATFALTGNYPNPFAGRTTLAYELPENARVKLEVYDLVGQRVGVLVNEARPAGRHEVRFDGQHLASGVYVARLQAGQHTSYRKMTLVN